MCHFIHPFPTDPLRNFHCRSVSRLYYNFRELDSPTCNSRIFISIYVNLKSPKNTRTILMCIVTVPTILGFALVAWLPTNNKAGRLIGYCTSLHHYDFSILIMTYPALVDLTGASNAVFVLALSLVSGNVGGATSALHSCLASLGELILLSRKIIM